MTKAQALSKKRSRLSLKGSDTPEKAKKQKKVVRKSNASLNIEQTPDPAAGYTEVGDDDWKPPTPLNGAWDPLVQAVDTIEKDDNNELWAYLVWNDKNHDGRFYRSKARLATCNTSCPQKVCFHPKQTFVQLPEIDIHRRCSYFTRSTCKSTILEHHSPT